MQYKFNEADQLDFKIRTLEQRIEQLHQKATEIVIAKTHYGKIRGAKRRGIYHNVYYSFEGIPYAQAPVGELRFRAPKPLPAWKGTRDCTHYGPKPVQRCIVDGRRIEGAEDCLYLNVYTNSVKPLKPRPVMVWIYGAGFACGEATRDWYAPDYFMKKDIVLVTLQYRFGALGFLSMKNPHLHTPGNAGLKDQILALKWIKRNCIRFGGNPECISVFGQGTGGAAIQLLMLSEQAKGLFQRAIVQSSVAVSDSEVVESTANAYRLAQAADYRGVNREDEILEFLRNCTATQIIEAEEKCVGVDDLLNNRLCAFGPCIEPYVSQHTVLYRAPTELGSLAWGNFIPLLIGANSNEGLIFEAIAKKYPQLIERSLQSCSTFVPKAAAPHSDSPECLEKGLKLRKIHVNESATNVDNFYELASYAHFWHPLQQTIDARLAYARKAPTYLYRFDFETHKLIHPLSLLRCGGAGAGAHADELAFLFGSVLAHRMERNSLEYQTIKRMIGLWTQFAETGNPNGVKINGMKGIKWQPVPRETAAAWKCLNISDELKFIELPERAKLKVWQQLYSLQRQLPKSSAAFRNFSVYAKSTL